MAPLVINVLLSNQGLQLQVHRTAKTERRDKKGPNTGKADRNIKTDRNIKAEKEDRKKRELGELNILWKSEEPMMSTGIVKKDPVLTQSTVTAVLRKQLSEKLVEAAGIAHSGRVLGRTCRPTEASRRAVMEHYLEELAGVSGIIKPEDLLAGMEGRHE